MPSRLYQPFYCEENVWQWLDKAAHPDSYALFITNAIQQVALWQQRLAPAGEPVLWDYHVVAVTRAAGRAMAWDRDSRLPLPHPLTGYLRQTFLPLAGPDVALAPQFRLVPTPDFIATFASDRRHMRQPDGSWQQPPPPWSPIGTGHTLDRFVDLTQPIAGVVLDLPALQQWARS